MSPTLQNRPAGTMTGGRALAEMLRLAGAGPMFGMGGFQLLPFYDAVGLVGLNHLLINDERCGAFAADAYARVTNRPGICDGTLGPGATNLVTGLVESLNGGIPIVAITGDTNRMHSWKNMTQESRQGRNPPPRGEGVDPRPEMTARIPELVRRGFCRRGDLRAARAWCCSIVPEDVAHGRPRLCARGFRHRRGDTQDAGAAHPARPCRHRARREADRCQGKTPAVADRRRHPPVGSLERADPLRRSAVDSGRTHDEWQGGIACTEPLSVGLFGRYSRIASDLIEASDCLDRHRLQAQRDRHQLLRPAAFPHPGDSSRHRRRRNRPLYPRRDRALGRCARWPGRPDRCFPTAAPPPASVAAPTMSPKWRRA